MVMRNQFILKKVIENILIRKMKNSICKGEDIIERNNFNFMYVILSHCR